MNWLLVGLAIGLSIFGVIAIYSATYMREEAYLKAVDKTGFEAQLKRLGILVKPTTTVP